MKDIKKTLIFFIVVLFVLGFFILPEFVIAACSGTPTACGSLGEGSCSTCGCTWNTGYCSDSGACSNCDNQTDCDNCSCANCSWGGTSCPWVGSWNGEEWVLEHEAFPFAAFAGVEATSYDFLPNLNCIDGKAQIKIYEGLPEKTFLKDFSVFKTPKLNGFIKPDVEGRIRLVSEKIYPDRCSNSASVLENDCLSFIREHDGKFFEPEFSQDRIDDWLVMEFDEISSESIKLYLVARKQAFLTTYYEYMVHIMGPRHFPLFSWISNWPVLEDIINDWWDDNLKMQVEVWDGQEWQRQGLISAGYHLPGSGADDFLVSLNKLDKDSDTLKVRLRFMTGSFGVDYVFLDQTLDPEIQVEEVFPEKIFLNNIEQETIAPREMIYDDSLILIYDCDSNEDFFFSITGYYLPQYFPKERQKSAICAWTEFLDFFSKGKENVISRAAEMGLYKDANNIEVFTAEEIKSQQKECLTYYLLLIIIALLISIIPLVFYKKTKNKTFLTLGFLLIFILWLIIGASFVYATKSCSGTLNCGNCSEANCISCTQCLWTSADCSGTPLSCDQHANESDCTSCGCTWTPSSISISVEDGSVSYGIMVEDSSRSTLSGDLNDTQTVTNNGDVVVNLDIKGQNATGGGCTWTLSSTNGNNQYIHQFCNDTDNNCSSPPTNYSALTSSYQTLKTGLAVDGTIDFHLRLTTPTETSCYGQQSVDVMIQATE